MMGSAKAHYEGIKAFSETDQSQDLKAISVPTLVKHGTLNIYKGYPHGMLTTHADALNADLLAFIKK